MVEPPLDVVPPVELSLGAVVGSVVGVEESGGVVVDLLVGGGGVVVLLVGGVVVSLRPVVVEVPGVVITVLPGGIGLPGGSVTGAADEPAGGRIVTVGRPSGPTLTTAVGEVESGSAASLIVPGTALPGMSCGPAGLLLPPLALSAAEGEGDASSAIPPNAVARTTPLAASRTYPLRFTRDAGSRGGDTSVR
ncbi:hypothetical protein [Amycolatopsis sp.]|uniref:hypothetical protein n=1 Tax=Amycolatopsis sp. TaxID=37632 RepID=UPI002D18E80B|nr:hypothetical protein [Amycolatopsis sp.]HVV13784.1 hypothetical protein [Amycolatopsis sp.]